MHLSFVEYDRPEEKRVYLSGLEDRAAPVQTTSWFDFYDVGANGFLRPHLYQLDVTPTAIELERTPSVSSFSAAGNKAATPGKAKVVQEHGQARQLISGRNFRDILEACRPRILGASLPTPLQSLLSLKLYSMELNEAKSKGNFPAKKRFTDVNIRLREWGAVDFNELPSEGLSKASRGGSPSPSAPFLFSAQSRVGSKGDRNDEVSVASSYSSTPGSSKYGTSYDRLFWDKYESPKTPLRAFQIQRSASLDLDVSNRRAYFEPTTSEEFAIMLDNSSARTIDDDSDRKQMQPPAVDKHADYLRKFMDSHDSMICGPRTLPIDEGNARSNLSESGTIIDPFAEITSKSGVTTKKL
jgi:hypothetical protein